LPSKCEHLKPKIFSEKEIAMGIFARNLYF